MKIFSWKIISLFVITLSLGWTTEMGSGYNIQKPNTTFVLPDILHEISGLTDIDQRTIACIQDENGIIFIYDIVLNKIKKQYNFHLDGDYEGITKVGTTMYVLRSDGVLFEFLNYESPNFKLKTYQTGIPAHNNEGLCYDADSNILLIANKGKSVKGKEFKDKRAIYGFDLKTKKLTTSPVYEFDINVIKKHVADKKIKVPTKLKKGENPEPFIKLMTSAIAIHPMSKKLYVLSAADHLFFVFNRNGSIHHIEPLSTTVFNKAEGITFLENGDMLITNEGQQKKPTFLRFNYKPTGVKK
ncbi:MAG TPA: hypothetical protein PK218_06555 [Flavobacterium sp.]|uniref:hypothetical protein n=1 Tax=Flavobacterium sp. TaxID=239 RepID=UPI002BB57B44|nr:hypothetical protein [Flavobacterium sp.]MCA0348116.1 hypothetical protein [Bacteroidota bacterium]HPW98201.1 hypothetical protein [Flavobacterium sp.]HQA73160.1 hypothetical protein [Flavobacterium sp.]